MELTKENRKKALQHLDQFWKNRQAQNAMTSQAYQTSTPHGVSMVDDANAFNYAPEQEDLRAQLEDLPVIKEHTDEQQESMFAKAANGIKNFGNDLLYSGRMWMSDLANQYVQQDETEISDYVQENNDLRLILEYKNLHNQLSELKKNGYTDDSPEVKEVQDKINKCDEYFTGEGRKHTAIAQYMYNPDNLSAFEKSSVNVMYALRDGGSMSDYSPLSDEWLNAANQKAVGVLGWAATSIEQGLRNLFGAGDSINGYKTGEVVKRLKEMGYNEGTVNHFMNTLYKGSDRNKDSIATTIDDKKINDWIKYNEDQIREKTIDLRNDLDFAQTGKLKYYINTKNDSGYPNVEATLNLGKVFDPNDIPEQFKKDQEKYSGEWYSLFVHPIYTFPETASTVGLFKHQLKAMAGDAGIGLLLSAITKKLPVFATSGAANKLQMAGSTMLGVNAAMQSRKDETNLEKIQALEERILQESAKKNVDINSVFSEIKDYAENNLGIDTSKMDDKKLLDLQIAYDIPVQTKGYKEASSESIKGIEKLVNANNALAFSDYIQSIPFMSYGASALKRMMLRKALNNQYGKAATLAERTMESFGRDAVNNVVGKVAKKFIVKDSPKLGLMLGHTANFVKDKAKLAIFEGLTEGAEEGAQELLQSRYRRGEFDSYNRPSSMMDTGELFSLPSLYKDAVLDYLGINYGDPDNASENLRKAMNVGFSSSMMFSNAMGAFTNFRSNPNLNNTRQLINQLKADNTVGNIVATYAMEAQDHAHIATFFDSYAKNGNSVAHVIRALNDLRNNVDESNTLVKKSDIDADIDLARATYSVYANKAINDELKAQGIKKNSEKHKQLVIDGATAIVDAWMTSDLVRKGRSDYAKRNNDHINIINAILDPETSPELKEKLIQENPFAASMINVLRDRYGVFKNNWVTERQAEFDAIMKSHSTYEDAMTDPEFADWALENDINVYEGVVDKSVAEQFAKHKMFNDRYGNFDKKEKFTSNRFVYAAVTSENKGAGKDDIKRILNNAWEDKNERRRIIQKANDIYKQGPSSEQQFIIGEVHGFQFYTKLNQVKKAYNTSKDRLERLKKLRSITGLDVNTDRLEGIVSNLKKQLDTLEEKEDIYVNGKGKNRNAEKKTLHDLYGQLGLQFDDQEDYENELFALQLNSAVLIPQLQIARIYQLGTTDDILGLQRAIYGEGASIIDDEVKEYNAKVTESMNADDLNADATALNKEAAKIDKEKISKKAAWKIINDRLNRAEQRMLIARRNYEDDRGIPEGTLQDGYSDEQSEAKEKLGTEKSDARKNLEKEVMHGGTQKEVSGKDRVKEQIEKRKNTPEPTEDESEDEFEEDDDATAGIGVLPENEDEGTGVTVAPPGGVSQAPEKLENPEPEDATESEDTEDDEAVEQEIQVDENEPSNVVREIVSAEDEKKAEEQAAVEASITEMDEEELSVQELMEQQENEAEEAERDAMAESLAFVDNLDSLYFDEETQHWYYEDDVLTDEQSEMIETELLLLGLAETVGVTQEQLPDGTIRNTQIKRVLATSDSIGDLVSTTFFYQPNPKVNEETQMDEVVHLKVGGQEVKFDKPIASGRQLAQKLLQKGWLQSAKKYYVVSQSQEGLKNLGDVRDSMTVVLCIEDDQNTYIVSLRQLGATISELNYDGKKDISDEEKQYLEAWMKVNEHGVFKDAESDLRAWLEMRNVDWSQLLPSGKGVKNDSDINRQKLSIFRKAVAKKAKENAYHWYISQHPGKKDFEDWWANGPKKGRNSNEKYAAEMTDYRRIVRTFIEGAKMSYALPGKKLLTMGQIEHQIQALREFRNSIIDAYAVKKEVDGKVQYLLPLTPKKTVVPSSVTQSNGRFDNVTKNGVPVFRNLFGNESVDDIQKKIESGEAVFGYGSGVYGDVPFQIRGVLSKDEDTQFEGRGLSGKIYMFVQSLANGAKKVPMMLTEERFDYQENEDGSRSYRDSIQLCLQYDASSKSLENVNRDRKPSAAEVLLYMICDKFDMGIGDYEKRRSVVEFFIHTGENTLLEHQPKYAKYPIKPFAEKQIAWHKREGSDEYVLTIAMPDGISTNGMNKYRVVDFTADELFGEGSEETRLSVVKAIASQMHWNTDVAHMNNNLNLASSGDEMSMFIMYMLQKYHSSDSNLYDQTVQIAGCPQLSLKVSDFFDKTSTGALVPKKNVSTLAWMVGNGKLMTDVSENIFYAPYVFAEGVQTENEPAEDIRKDVSEKMKPVDEKAEDPAFSIVDQTKLDWVVSEYGADQLDVSKDEDAAKQILDELNSQDQAKKNDGFRDRILFVPPQDTMDVGKGMDHFMARLNEFIEKYNQAHPDNKLDPKNIQFANEKAKTQISTKYGAKQVYVIANIFNNGVIKISAQNVNSWKQRVTGIFSSKRAKGKFDEQSARKWLSNTLGIDQANVVVTDAVMKSMTNEQVFGLTNVCLDRISEQTTGYIVLSTDSGIGVTYHEAWHYVNLLMHDKDTRVKIYQEYYKKHKNRYKDGATILQIEEDLADEFMRYVEARNDNSIIGRVKRLFDNILDFVSVSRRKSAYRNAFKAIQKGQYKGAKLDEQSVEQFKERYSNGIAQLNYALPGHSFKDTQDLKSIDRYQQYFDAFRSISNKLILDMDITTVEQLISYTKEHENFQDVLDTIQDMMDELDPDEDEGYSILSDLLKNKALTKKMFAESMMELGLKTKIKSVKNESDKGNPEAEDEDPTAKEDHADNTWDRVQLTLSKKDNAAIRTKLFFRTIPMFFPNVLEDGTVQYVPDNDDYNVQKMWSFDEAWNLLLNELFSCTSFGNMEDGKYVKTSIMGRVESLKDSSKFWNAVWEKLSALENKKNIDTQLKSQIFSTLCSNKNQISFIQIENPRDNTYYDEDFEYEMDFDDSDLDDDFQVTYESEATIADRSRVWRLMGDDALTIARNVPRRWSKNLASKGFLSFDRTQNKSSINESFVNKAIADLQKIKRSIKDAQNKKNIDYNKVLYGKDGLIEQSMQLFQYIGIPVDKEVMQGFVSLNSKVKGKRSLTSKEYFETLNEIFSQDKAGSISSIMDAMKQSIGKDEIVAVGRQKKNRPLDGLFDNYRIDSQIGLMAIAYNNNHPNLQDYSVKGPNGDTYYPINQNNFVTGQTRAINDKSSGKVEQMRKAPYCSASIILDAAEKVSENDESTKIKLNTFVGMKDANRQRGADYFGITVLEDYLAKMYMTELDQIIFPTMADKKTWYSLSSSNIKLVRDIVLDRTPWKFVEDAIYEAYSLVNEFDENSDNTKSKWRKSARAWYYNLKKVEKTDPEYAEAVKTLEKIDRRADELLHEKDLTNVGINQFSNETLQIFSNYFLSELDTLIQYYSREHIQSVVNNPNSLKENYHGKISEVERGGVKTKRLDFSGNGGKFRYFYDVVTFKAGRQTINLNQRLQALYELQIKIENGTVKNLSAEDTLYSHVGTGSIQEVENGKALPLDGFELIRAELNRLKKQYRDEFSAPTQSLKTLINAKLMNMVQDEIKVVTTPGSPFQLGTMDEFGRIKSTSIPERMLNRYAEALQEKELSRNSGNAYDESSYDIQHNMFYNIISNYVLNSFISTIEIEKIYSGDPAFYKWKKNQAQGSVQITFNHTLYNNAGQEQKISEKLEVEQLDDTYSDKIKRLGGMNSPGAEMRLDYSQAELQRPGNETLACSHYTVLNVEDIEIPSFNLDEIKDTFRKQLIVDWIRCEKPKEFTKAVEINKKQLDGKDPKIDEFEHQIDLIYNSDKFFQILLKEIPAQKLAEIEEMLKRQIKPYEKITVADAQVFIRPELYRKIKKGLGEWSDNPDSDGYSDEIAYQLIENNTYMGKKVEDGAWMSDPKLYKIVKKFQTNTLKMSYFQNATEQLYKNSFVNLPIYNKMAIFPLFKYHRSTQIGRDLYDRMNDSKLGQLDMVAFKSAVKVGGIKNAPSLVESIKPKYDENGHLTNKEDIEKSVTSLNEVLGKPSNKKIDYINDEISDNSSNESIPVSVQDLRELRLQLNTHAHESTERAMGTQMFKLAFSNIVDEAYYGTGKSGRKPRKGKEIKADIMRCIDALTNKGIQKLRQRFFKTVQNEDGTSKTVLDQREIERFVKDIVEGNGLGISAEEIIASGGVVASLTQRSVFEQSVSSLVNQEVVDIKTKGGTAIQQSMYLFADWASDKDSVDSDYLTREDMALDHKLSLKITDLDLSVRLEKALKDLGIETVRDLIKKKPTSLNDKLKNEVESVLNGLDINWDTNTEFARSDKYIKYNNGKELKWSAKEGSMEVLLSMNFFKAVVPAEYQTDYTTMRMWLIDHDVIKGTKSDGTKSNPKPFGIGYRIPTQGMSSMFGFIVADVLPEQVGDLIVVPREFTAQTGSDFDVDKLYLSTYSYLNGQRETENGYESTTGAISNTLLDNYLDIISDIRNYANARASIDVITNIIQEQLLDKVLRTRQPGYRKGMSQLLPSFQCSRKREFGVGKDGIGPFALNITNMALTQYVHLTFDYMDNAYQFGQLDQIYGEDGNRISDWLSAMVNAHVDVAKDAYVFDLNVNKVTYNHANFLIRAGKGKKTFLLLAQPILKKYTESLLNGSGIYGAYISEEELNNASGSKKTKLINKLVRENLEKIKKLAEDNEDRWTAEQDDVIRNVLYYYTRMITPVKSKREKTRAELGLEEDIPRIEPKKVMFVDGKSVFGVSNRGENAIKNINGTDILKKMDALIFQLYAMEAFMDIEPYAQAISELVQSSKIDTKKFGNNIVSQFNFENNMMHFRYTSTLFTINDPNFVNSLPEKRMSDGSVAPLTAADISKYALDRYFGDMFLDKKLNAALKYERLLLNGQSFKASGLYKSIFFTVCSSIFGSSNVVDTTGKVYPGYAKVYDDDVIQAIGDAIDDVMRYNAFMSVGYQEYQEIYKKNPDVIDFTFGGNPSLAVSYMKSLLFGIQEETENGFVEVQPSIFDRVSDLIQDIKSNPRKAEYRNLIDSDGNIINDLLLYLTPMSPTENYPIGRMLLAQAQHLVKGDRKARLIAAFSELLTSSDEKVNKLAHDLAIYAYFSTYDQNVRNSFFDIVPARFRQQYDRSLKHVLQKMRNTSSEVQIEVLRQISGASEGVDFESALTSAANTIIDVMSRNYWYDDNYVKRFSVPKVSSSTLQGNGATVYGTPETIIDGGDLFPTWIATSKVDDGSLYIKVVSKSGKTTLYRKTGTIQQMKEGKNGLVKGANFSVYTVVPKAGLHNRGQNQFELYCDYEHPSIFDQNRISSDFAEDVVRKQIEEFVERDQNQESAKCKLELTWFYEQIPSTYMSENLESYRSPDEQEPVKKLKGAKFWFKDNAHYKMCNSSDVIIYLNNVELEDIGSAIAKKHKDKAVSAGLNTDLKSIIDKVKQLVQGKTEDGISLTFESELFDGQWNVPEEYFNQKLEEAVQAYKATLSVDDQYVSVLVRQKEEDLKSDYKFKNSVTTQFVAEKMAQIIDAILTETTVKTLQIAASNGKTVFAKAAAILHKDFASKYSDGVTKIYADQKMKQKKYHARQFRQQLIDEFKASVGVLDQNLQTASIEDQTELEIEQAEDTSQDEVSDKKLYESEQESEQESYDDFDEDEEFATYGAAKQDIVEHKSVSEIANDIVTSASSKWNIDYSDDTDDYEETEELEGSDLDINNESKDTENHTFCGQL